MDFNAWNFARSWASVALAQANDKSRPNLHRSTLIEIFPEGVRLVSTDGYVLLKAWVPTDDGDEPEPGSDVLPDDTALCADPDLRVLGLMKYAQQITKQDGDDTMVTITMGFGEMSETGRQGTLDGMTQASVWFRLGQEYDERIETPRFQGEFPNWRPLWFGHKWSPTSLVGFGADGILRLGKLSALWDKSTIEFALGGSNGVARVSIQAPNVNVDGLVMPVRLTGDRGPVPVSDEGLDVEYGDALDEFLASVLAEEDEPVDDEMLSNATKAQVERAYRIGVAEGHLSVQVLVDQLDISAERCSELLDILVEQGAIEALDDDKYSVQADLDLFPEDDDDLEVDEVSDGEEPV